MYSAVGTAQAVVLLTLGNAQSVQAVEFTGQQIAANEWTYDLAFAPLENYSVFPVVTQSSNITTITLTGLYGVVGAAGPTSTDFPANGFIDVINLNWTPHVLNGGTEVQWTHVGPGTGNFDTEKHVFGFQVFANGATDGLVAVATSGMSRDISDRLPDGSFNLDITGFVPGPVVPEPATLSLLGSAILSIGGMRMLKLRRRATPIGENC
jgi:hypothetical protein